jgi:hypothetical protein
MRRRFVDDLIVTAALKVGKQAIARAAPVIPIRIVPAPAAEDAPEK